MKKLYTPVTEATFIILPYPFSVITGKTALVKYVAAQCGYSDVFGFSKAYLRYYGFSPGKT